MSVSVPMKCLEMRSVIQCVDVISTEIDCQGERYIVRLKKIQQNRV